MKSNVLPPVTGTRYPSEVEGPDPGFIPFRPSELQVFRKRTRLPGPQWAEKHLHVPRGKFVGAYRNSNNPPLYGIMEWFTRRSIRTVVLAKGIQTGGTLAAYALLLREVDYAYAGDAALIVMADEKSGKKLSRKRLHPMIEGSPRLADLKSPNPDDFAMYAMQFRNGCVIDLGWASSEMSVSSESYRVIILDEISKYSVRGNIQDAKGRATVYEDTKKIFILSSPGVDSDDHRDPLMVELEQCDIIMEYRVACPVCGKKQPLTFEQFRWPGQPELPGILANDDPRQPLSADPKQVRLYKQARYECAGCGSLWDDYQRDRSVSAAMKTGWHPAGVDCPEGGPVSSPGGVGVFGVEEYFFQSFP